jgi:hypothetical protein
MTLPRRTCRLKPLSSFGIAANIRRFPLAAFIKPS